MRRSLIVAVLLTVTLNTFGLNTFGLNTFGLNTFGPALVRAAPAIPATMPIATKFSVAMTLIEPSGATLASRNVDVTLGVSETTTVQRKSRTVAIDTMITAGRKPGCYKIDLVVRDRNIDATGRFNKTVWQSATEPCDPQPITLGPKAEIRVRVAVKPAG